MKKRLLALALALMLVLTLLPSVAMAKEESFADVRPADWYYNAVCFAAENGLMSGTGAGFAPDAPTTRAMLWTILARLDGQTAKHTGPDWYAAAQLWAVRNDISDGTEPDGTITREQLAAMLYRFAQRKGLVRAASPADLSAFTDAASVSAYAQEAVQWAVANGLIAGMDGRLVPQGSATRAQIAQILSRMCEKWSLLPQSNAAILAGAGAFQQPEHKHTWSAAVQNSDGTHTSSCECGETMTKYCTLVPQTGTESWSCSVCGFTVEGKKDAGVSTWEELKAAVEVGKSPIYLANDLALEEPIEISVDTIIRGEGHKLTFAGDTATAMIKMSKDKKNRNKKITLADVVLDGENKENDGTAVIIRNVGDLEILNSEIRNFHATQLVKVTSDNGYGFMNVTIRNTRIHDNTLTASEWEDPNNWAVGQHGSDYRATLFYFDHINATFENVKVDHNTVSRKIKNDPAGRENIKTGSGYLLYARWVTTYTLRETVIEENEAPTLFGSYLSDEVHHMFESGLIQNNKGQFDVYGDMTVGEDMTIALGETYTFWFTNSSGTRTLTNNGTILARVAQHDWSKTKAVYKGTGTVKELAEVSFDIR